MIAPQDLGLPERIRLLRCPAGEAEDANLVWLTRELAEEGIDKVWWPDVAVKKEVKRKETDWNWKWVEYAGFVRAKLGQFGYAWAAQTADRAVQGAIIYRINDLSYLEEGAPAVYCDYLATAPRNRAWLATDPCYTKVGTGLLTLAVTHSYLLGMGGRLNLISKDDERTVSWYKKYGFQETGQEMAGMLVLELTPEQAARHLPIEP
jgi:hypothetical protein